LNPFISTSKKEGCNSSKRRTFLKASAAGGLASAAGVSGPAGAQALGTSTSANTVEFKPVTRCPDVSVEILDPGFAKYRLYSASVEQEVVRIFNRVGVAHGRVSRNRFADLLARGDWKASPADRRIP